MIPRIIARQAPLSMGFSRPEYWSGMPFPSLLDHSDPGIEPRSPALRVYSLPSEAPGKPQDREMNPGFGDESAEP